MKTKIETVDEYIAAQTRSVAERLSVIRNEVKKLAPAATEKLSYGMPYYGLNGRLLYFAAHQGHIGLYPMKATIAAFETELKGYETSAGTIRLPHDKPLPLPLICKIIQYRIKAAGTKTA